MSASGFLCPECRVDLGSVDGLMKHFKEYHQKKQITERIKNVFKPKDLGLPSEKAQNRENEERRRFLENDGLLTLTGGIDVNLFSRQEPVLVVPKTSEFREFRKNAATAPLSQTDSVFLSAKIYRLIDIATLPVSERKVEEQKVTLWAPDAAAPLCMNCGLSFGIQSALVLARRHHCRVCGAVVCSDCCQSVLYSALSEIVNREMAPSIPSEDTIKICEYCFLEILKLKDRVDQKETDSVVMSIYSRWTKVKNEIAKNLQELPNHSREPIVFKNLATRIETEMRKLDRLAKQLANIEEIDVRFLKGIRRLTATILQDAKIQIVTNKPRPGGSAASSKSSPFSSPLSSIPSTPQFSSTPERSNSPTVPNSRFRSALILPEVERPVEPVSKNPFDEPSTTSTTKPFEEHNGNSGNPFFEDENENYDNSKNPFAEPGDDRKSNLSQKSGKIVMSERCADLFSGKTKTDEEVQIEFLIKDIQKARSKGDLEKASMIQSVLDQLLQDQN